MEEVCTNARTYRHVNGRVGKTAGRPTTVSNSHACEETTARVHVHDHARAATLRHAIIDELPNIATHAASGDDVASF
eukprot:5381596-Lingulodinium_polyedra.AAC.1